VPVGIQIVFSARLAGFAVKSYTVEHHLNISWFFAAHFDLPGLADASAAETVVVFVAGALGLEVVFWPLIARAFKRFGLVIKISKQKFGNRLFARRIIHRQRAGRRHYVVIIIEIHLKGKTK